MGAAQGLPCLLQALAAFLGTRDGSASMARAQQWFRRDFCAFTFIKSKPTSLSTQGMQKQGGKVVFLMR